MKKFLAFFLLTLFLVPSTVLAVPFEINFTGELESLTQGGVLGVNVIDSVFTTGDSVSGRIIVDTNDQAPATISLFELTIGSYTASAAGGSAIVRDDNMAGSAAPVVDSIVIAGSSFTSTPIGGFSVDRLQFAVGTENLAVLNAGSVVGPSEIAALWNDTPNYFSGNLNFMSFGNGQGSDETARFALTSVTVSVPEPSTLFLFGAGFLGLAGIGRKRFKQ